MTRERTLTVQHTVYMTPEMWNYLTQLALKRGHDCNENTLIREAVRLFIDSQAEVIGSRRHFQKSFQERIDQLEQRLSGDAARNAQTALFYAQIAIQLVAISMAHLLSAVTRKEVTAQQLVQRAVVEARRGETTFGAQVQSVRDMPMPREP